MKKINIIANTIIEPGMSGGNRIFIENAKHWLKKGVKIRVFTSNVGKKLCQENGLTKAEFQTWCLPFEKQRFSKPVQLGLYFLALIKGIFMVAKINFGQEIIFSSSDYWPDSLSAFFARLKNPQAKWIAGFFLFAPKPWQKDWPYKGVNCLTGLLYWLTQLPIYWLVKRYADMVFVTSEPDVEKFITKKRDENKIIVVRGGVDTRTPTKIPEPKKKKYEAVFIGRFHPQKGVLELIDIWKRVVEKRPEAKLAMIGNGPLITEIKSKIKKEKLEKNIDLLGFLDGIPKIKIFKSSKIVVHPAIYDSGGMAACEAMAAGLPGVSFDLEALKTYYPKGMLKTSKFKLDQFADNIIELLDNKDLYQKTKAEALGWAEEWDWDKRAEEILRELKKLF